MDSHGRDRLRTADRRSPAAGSCPCRRSAQCRDQGCYPDRGGRAGRRCGGDRDRRSAGSGHRQSPAGKGRTAGRLAFCHRRHRSVGHTPFVRPDARVRYLVHDRHEFPMGGVPSGRWSGACRTDRPRPRNAWPSLSRGCQPPRRCGRNATGPEAASTAQGRSILALRCGSPGGEMVGDARRAPWPKPPPSIRNEWSGRCRLDSRPTPSSLRTPDPAPTGTRATGRFTRASAALCPGDLPPWGLRFPMPLQPSSPIPNDR